MRSEVSIVGKTWKERSVKAGWAFFESREPAKTRVDSLHVLVEELRSVAVKPTIFAEDVADAGHVLLLTKVFEVEPILIAKVLDKRTSPANSVTDP